MSISLDGLEGPGRYGLNRNMDMTVLVAKDQQVVDNFAINGPNNNDAPEILAAIARTIDRPTPSLEKIRDEIRADRQRKRDSRYREDPVYKLAPNDELGRMMVAMVKQEQASEAGVKETMERMQRWAGKDQQKRELVAQYARRLLNGNFSINRYAREALEQLLDE